MPNFKKYDFVRFEINGNFDRITYVKDVDESKIYVDGKWYTPCGDVVHVYMSEDVLLKPFTTGNKLSYIPPRTFTLRRCCKEDIDTAKNNKRFNLNKYFECVELRRQNNISPTDYND